MAKRKTREWVSVVEASRRLGISRAAVYQAIEEGRLRAKAKTIVRKVLRIDPDSLDTFRVSTSHKLRAEAPKRRRR